MNANELADSLDVESSQAEYGYVVDDWKLFRDAATMLRQQQLEIEALKALIHQRNEPLGAEFEKVLKDNLWQLYEEDKK